MRNAMGLTTPSDRLRALARVASSPQIARDHLRRAAELDRISASLS
jgi:hypothetical protein